MAWQRYQLSILMLSYRPGIHWLLRMLTVTSSCSQLFMACNRMHVKNEQNILFTSYIFVLCTGYIASGCCVNHLCILFYDFLFYMFQFDMTCSITVSYTMQCHSHTLIIISNVCQLPISYKHFVNYEVYFALYLVYYSSQRRSQWRH